MKINKFIEFHGISRRILSDCLDIPKNKDESDSRYRDRKYQRVRRRELSDWEMMYCDGVVTMRAPDGGEKKHGARKLDEYIETL